MSARLTSTGDHRQPRRHRRTGMRSLRRLLRRPARAVGDRGDVPGWVLVTVMTAGLVSALWIVADDLLAAVFRSAVDAVTGP